MLELAEIRAIAQPFEKKSLVYPWKHPDPHVDVLGARVFRLVDHLQKKGASRAQIFEAIWDQANVDPLPRDFHLVARATVPYLDEPWYC